MRRLLSLAIAVLLVVTTTAFAAPQTAKAKATATSKAAWISGTLERYDSASNSLVVKRKSGETTLVLGEKAVLMQGKRTLNAADLSSEIGHSVRVKYVVDGATKRAERVELTAMRMARNQKPPAKK